MSLLDLAKDTELVGDGVEHTMTVWRDLLSSISIESHVRGKQPHFVDVSPQD